MNSRSIAAKLRTEHKLVVEKGLPPHEFYPAAWNDEPLTQALAGTDIVFALPAAIPELSFVAKNETGEVIAQCATNDTVAYWDHVKKVDTSTQNTSTRTFVDIHRLAAIVEQCHLAAIGADIHESAHNAGIAVLPKDRGRHIGVTLTEQQIAECDAAGKTTLFCETTNKYSAAIMAHLNFFKVASYPYQYLAARMSNPDLDKLDDSFTIWCKTPFKLAC